MRRIKRGPALLSIVLVLMLLTSGIASAATYHTVTAGEWLSTIAPKYGTTWEKLLEANSGTISDANLILPGQKLLIPDGAAAPGASVVPAASATVAPIETSVPAASAAPSASASSILGRVTADFQPADEVPGIPEARIRDTALMDLINRLQKDAVGADVSGAALPFDSAALKTGDLPSDLFAVPGMDTVSLSLAEITGKELKAVMEHAVSVYNPWKPGDVTVSFDPSIPVSALDFFSGVQYSVDISQPAGKRIVDLTFGGKAVTDTQKIKLVLPTEHYNALKTEKIVSEATSLTTSAVSLKASVIALLGTARTLTPSVDNNWSLIGANLSNPLRDDIIAKVKAGTLALPKSSDGKTMNAKSLNVYELITNGTLKGYKEIDLFHTNDTHGRIKAGDGMGFAKISTLVSNYKAANPSSLLLDIGDTVHGLNFVTLSRGESAVQVMNMMNYDAMAPGNHDFNYGQTRLTELGAIARFPILSANVKKADGSNYLTPYVIKTVNGVKVALFGLATPETVYKTNPKNIEGLKFEDPIVSAKAMVAELAGKADIVVAMAHLGIEGDFTSRKLAAAVPEIDVILDGHSHSILNETVNGVLIAQTGYYDMGLGITSLIVKDGKLAEAGTALYTMKDAKNTPESTLVKSIVASVDKEVSTLTSVVIGTSPVLLDGERANVRTKPTNLANLITAAMLDKTGADVAITNGGGIRASIKAGSVTKGDVLTVLPFGNYVVVKELKGSDIKSALELGVSTYPAALGGYAQTAGLTFRFDSTKPTGNRVVEVKVNGLSLDPAKTYKVATNDFMAVGGDNYTMLKNGPTLGEYPALDEILIEYIQTKGFGAAVTDGRATDTSAPAVSIVLKPAA